ncbi:MAG TPA: hypothetical protein VHO02_00520 [Fibrobacteria bacterium]|jgi:hypothetical protein|nr:hypothetical protein [Fibrobacteria bacterium]
MAKVRALALILPLVLSAGAFARDGMGFDAVVAGVFPMRDYKETVSAGMGVLGGVELPILPPLSLTARVGGIVHFPRKDMWRLQLPAFGGAKLTSQTSLYLAAEGGPVLTRDYYRGDDSTRTGHSATPMAWGMGVGSAIDEHDIRLAFHVWDWNHPKETLTFSISLAILYLGG